MTEYDRQDDAIKIINIKNDILALVKEAKAITYKHLNPKEADKFNTYVFSQINSYCIKGNPFGSDLEDVSVAIKGN